ncbi:MAG: cation-transporting P-type ATPase [wastewater metagenome]|nr:cation-transporting P-type ATPase [Candidatus Loosdrechtia aerotolerans]
MQKTLVQPIHTSVNGRARFKVGGLYRSELLGKHLESRLSNHDRINGFSINVLTGNILIFYNSTSTHYAVASFIEGFVLEYKKTNGNRLFETKDRKKQKGRRLSSDERRSGAKSLGVQRGKKLGKLTVGTAGQRIESWHLKGVDYALNLFATDKDRGLSRSVTVERLRKYGYNVMPESPPRSAFSILFGQFKSLPVMILLVAAGLSIFTGGVVDALVIMSVVAINATIGYITENQAERIINSLKRLIKPSSLVIRAGVTKEIRAEEVVLGDIMVLRAGVYITADCRVIDASLLSIDESALTGESRPVTKTSETIPMNPEGRDIPIADRVNMVYAGTLVTGGQGFAIVVATGRFTEIGRIQMLVGEAKPPETPMERQLNKIGKQLVAVGGGVCGIVFLMGLLRGYGLLEMLKTSISLAVAAIPEGLPTVATTTLTIGIMSMRKRNVIIRHLDAVEALGSIQTICLDKTGTITMNRMTVVEIYAGMKRLQVCDGKYLKEGEPINPHACKELLKLIHVTTLCNETEVSIQRDGYALKGSPTESAFITMAISSGIEVVALRERYPLLRIKHRAERHNFMITVHQSVQHRKFIALKGNPSEVQAMCSWQIRDGEKIPITDEDRVILEKENERMAGDALRVLGVAYQHTENDQEEPDLQNGFTWLGLIGMADPVRRGVKELINEFHGAGIDTVMITGDQTPTAYAIGRELNLSGNGELKILESAHLANIDPEVLKVLCGKVHVFARVSPAHKLQIVQALQRAGKVVAMTGDGINDGPALKAADIGIAMGHSGTDVAREVADIVLEDDNLETMVTAVSHGRTIYSNIRKSLHFLLSTNMSEIIVTFGAIAGGIGQPLNAMQLLWINLMSDVFPAIALSLELPEPDVLNKPPRNPNEHIIKGTDFKRITLESSTLSTGALGAYMYGMMRYGIGPRASTMAFMSLTTAQLLHAVSCRSETHSIFDRYRNRPSLPPNKYLNIALGGSLILQVLTLAVPGLRNILRLSPIGILDGIVVGGSAILPLFINEGTKRGEERGTLP